jgi:hypothetical protein
MFLNDHTLDVPGRRVLAARAKQRCGKPGLASSAVTFHDSLSPVCCQTFTLYVAKGSRAWIVFGHKPAGRLPNLNYVLSVSGAVRN